MAAPDKPAELAAYPVVVSLPIQWGDQDSFGHVNNVVYVRWFESARIAYFEACGLSKMIAPGEFGPILALVTCNYRRQLNYPDTVLVGARIERIGTSSLNVHHVVYSRLQNAAAADGQSVIVMFNYQDQRPQRVPDEMRAAILRLEGRELDE